MSPVHPPMGGKEGITFNGSVMAKTTVSFLSFHSEASIVLVPQFILLSFRSASPPLDVSLPTSISEIILSRKV